MVKRRCRFCLGLHKARVVTITYTVIKFTFYVRVEWVCSHCSNKNIEHYETIPNL